MPKICIDCRYVGNRPSGIGEVVRGLLDHAPTLAPDLNFVLLRNQHGPARLSTCANVSEVTIPHAANGPATMWWLPRVVDLTDIDLFHATFNILPAGLTMPTLTTLHDMMWLTDPKLCRTGLRAGIERAFYGHGIRRALRRSSHIATVSAASREAAIAWSPALAERVSVTLSGVSSRFKPVRADRAMLQQAGLKPGSRFFLSVGQYAPYKNHERAVEAFATAFGEAQDHHLLLVQRQGSGSQKLARLAGRLGVAGRVHLSSAVDADMLLQLYSGATALLHPSLVEGFGNPVAEAMACGCPVITSDRSAMPQVAGGAAALVNPLSIQSIAQAMRDVAGDPALAQRMREAGLKRAGELSWISFAQANVDIYRALLSPS